MKYDLIVFDLDGTLVNSLDDLAAACNEGLKAAKLPTHEPSEYKKFVGNGRDKLIERAMRPCSDPGLRETVRSVFDSYYAAHSYDNTKPYSGCAELLKRLCQNGVKTAVLSNKPDEFVAAILSKTYPGFCFDLAWGQKPGMPCKPDGTSLGLILSELASERSACLYVGDSDVDVFTARNAGVDMLGVDWGFRGREELISAGAPAVVSEPGEIWSYIND